MSQQTDLAFDEALCKVVDDWLDKHVESKAESLMQIPGIYEILSEEFNMMYNKKNK